MLELHQLLVVVSQSSNLEREINHTTLCATIFAPYSSRGRGEGRGGEGRGGEGRDWLTLSERSRAWHCSLLGLAWCITMVCVGSSKEAWGGGGGGGVSRDIRRGHMQVT